MSRPTSSVRHGGRLPRVAVANYRSPRLEGQGGARTCTETGPDPPLGAAWGQPPACLDSIGEIWWNYFTASTKASRTELLVKKATSFDD
ncbi:hypothetical protein MTO96_032253 [Rhipicephalus appendiculatus]